MKEGFEVQSKPKFIANTYYRGSSYQAKLLSLSQFRKCSFKSVLVQSIQIFSGHFGNSLLLHALPGKYEFFVHKFQLSPY